MEKYLIYQDKKLLTLRTAMPEALGFVLCDMMAKINPEAKLDGLSYEKDKAQLTEVSYIFNHNGKDITLSAVKQ